MLVSIFSCTSGGSNINASLNILLHLILRPQWERLFSLPLNLEGQGVSQCYRALCCICESLGSLISTTKKERKEKQKKKKTDGSRGTESLYKLTQVEHTFTQADYIQTLHFELYLFCGFYVQLAHNSWEHNVAYKLHFLFWWSAANADAVMQSEGDAGFEGASPTPAAQSVSKTPA